MQYELENAVVISGPFLEAPFGLPTFVHEERTAGADHKLTNAYLTRRAIRSLWAESLIAVFVARQQDVYAILLEQIPRVDHAVVVTVPASAETGMVYVGDGA